MKAAVSASGSPHSMNVSMTGARVAMASSDPPPPYTGISSPDHVVMSEWAPATR